MSDEKPIPKPMAAVRLVSDDTVCMMFFDKSIAKQLPDGFVAGLPIDEAERFARLLTEAVLKARMGGAPN